MYSERHGQTLASVLKHSLINHPQPSKKKKKLIEAWEEEALCPAAFSVRTLGQEMQTQQSRPDFRKELEVQGTHFAPKTGFAPEGLAEALPQAPMLFPCLWWLPCSPLELMPVPDGIMEPCCLGRRCQGHRGTPPDSTQRETATLGPGLGQPRPPNHHVPSSAWWEGLPVTEGASGPQGGRQAARSRRRLRGAGHAVAGGESRQEVRARGAAHAVAGGESRQEVRARGPGHAVAGGESR